MFLLKSFLLGLVAAFSVGPVFILIVYRSVVKGRAAGLMTALGLALADSILFMAGLIGAKKLINLDLVLAIKTLEKIGGILLIVLGSAAILKKEIIVKKNQICKKQDSFFECVWTIVSSSLLTITNPLTLLFFASVSMKLFPSVSTLKIQTIVLGGMALFCGSLTSFSTISTLAYKFGDRFSKKFLAPLKFISGFTFLSIGFYLIFSGSC